MCGWRGFPVEEDFLVEGDVEALRMLCWEDVGMGRTYNEGGYGIWEDVGYGVWASVIRDN